MNIHQTATQRTKLFNPKSYQPSHPSEDSNALLTATRDWFEAKGLESIHKDWHDKVWNYSFVEFMKEHQAFATLMTPEGYGDNAAWNTRRNVEFAEVIGFYGITYWYTFQVSMLGIGPVFNGDNEDLKHRTVQLMKDGEVFAFGLSEKDHGADIYSSEMTLEPQGDGTYLANGSKYYIGNGNEAALISTFGKNSETGEYVFFVVDSKHEKYTCVKNTVHEQIYVSEYRLDDYPITEADITCQGQKAWDDMLNTINYCKFNLGFGSIGMGTHALYESIAHSHNRWLYGKRVTEFSHVRRMLADAYLRLMAMKMFCYRATDYLRSASENDRRYLLFNPMVKMKATMQGERVVADLVDVIAARSFEADSHTMIVKHEVSFLPRLEGTAHVNMALVNKFMKNYMFNPDDSLPEIGERLDNANDNFLFHQGPTHGLGKIRFHDYRKTYDRFDTPNLKVFKEQIATFSKMLEEASPNEEQMGNPDFMLSVGELFTLVAYGHLILERAGMEGAPDELINQMFDVFIRDFSVYASTVYGKNVTTDAQRKHLLAMIKAPVRDDKQFQDLWENEILPLSEAYIY